MAKTVVISLGGSVIYPDGIDTNFLKGFKKIVERFIKKGCKFVIYCGGGKLARNFQKAAAEISKVPETDLDILGIHSTELNAHLLRLVFKKYAEDFIVSNPNIRVKFRKKIIVAAGWLPGCSTDYDAVLIAKNLGIKEVINMSNVDYVYDKDPRMHKDARKIEKMSWSQLLKLTGTKWKAGLNTPFDPIAAKEAKKMRMKAFIVGKNLENFSNLLDGKKFSGTEIG